MSQRLSDPAWRHEERFVEDWDLFRETERRLVAFLRGRPDSPIVACWDAQREMRALERTLGRMQAERDSLESATGAPTEQENERIDIAERTVTSLRKQFGTKCVKAI